MKILKQLNLFSLATRKFISSSEFIVANQIFYFYFLCMWNNKYIDDQLSFRLNAITKITIEDHPFTGGNFTQFYYYNSDKILVYNRKPDGTLIGNFVICELVKNDPKGAIEFNGRPNAWGKRLVLSKCGNTDSEKFNYISELLYQVIEQLK